MLEFPHLSPVIVQLGPLAIRWYGLAYIVGILSGGLLIKKQLSETLTTNETYDLIFFATLGILLGGRLGYVLFYDLAYYLEKPLSILAFWEGGMSFHGGAVGIGIALFLFSRLNKKPFFILLDALAIVAPLGLFFGRLANFVNAELYGRVTTVPWAMIFPGGGALPRHPSQLYEALGEGLLLGLSLLLIRKKISLKPGQLMSLFLIGYGCIRFAIEFFREPDVQLGLFLHTLSMGQLLCLSMVALGGLLFQLTRRAL